LCSILGDEGDMIGKKINRLRQQKGYSITELGRLAEVSQSYLSQLERGLQTNPSLQFLIKVSKPLDTSIDFLLQESKTQKSVDNDLDEEWKVLIRQAFEDGLRKEDFHEYRKYIKFQEWLREKNES
jgi:XRE family transcriptional regulator, master regulator for biofilm formation